MIPGYQQSRKTEDMKTKVSILFALSLLSLAMVVAINSAHGVAQNDNKNKGPRTAEQIYAKECATCHGKDGEAKTFKSKFTHARNFTDGQWQDSVSDERLFNSITNGKGKMPAWGKKFSEAEINSLVKYVRQFKK